MISRRILLAAPALAFPAACAHSGAHHDRSRLGVTTVGFRERFQQTSESAGSADLTLLQWPSFVRETFALPYAELWSRHFDAPSIAYCNQLRTAAHDAGVQIINIQLDPFPADEVDMAAADEATRLADVDKVKAWMDRSKACGAPFLRANTDKATPGRAFDVNVIADSFRRLAEYGQTIGVTILVENHGGYSRDLANVAAVVRAVDHPNCRALADWGNSPGADTTERIASLEPIAPFTALVSAKGRTFDETTWTHRDYDVAAMTEASERAGYTGVYSIELYAVPGPSDPTAAVRSMIAAISTGIQRART